MSDNGAPYYIAKTGLESMPLTFGDGALANTFGTSAIVSGADNLPSVREATTTAPETSYGGNTWLNLLQSQFQNLAGIPNPVSASAVAGKQASEAVTGAVTNTFKTVAIAVLFVVIGLLIISRGFGLIGEEGTETVLKLEDPGKFPGIGHAIQGLKKGKK